MRPRGEQLLVLLTAKLVSPTRLAQKTGAMDPPVILVEAEVCKGPGAGVAEHPVENLFMKPLLRAQASSSQTRMPGILRGRGWPGMLRKEALCRSEPGLPAMSAGPELERSTAL